MKNDLNSVQRAKIKDVLENARTMRDDDLKTLRNNIASSNGNIKVKELILEGIDSIMNREKLTNIATVCDGDTNFDEE